MASLRVLVPESTTNYVTNPALRYDTSGWAAFSATITRTLNYARFGIASLQVVTNGTALNEGAYFRVSALSGITDNITVSAYVRGAGKVRIRLIDQFKGQQWASQPIALTNVRWKRIEISGNNVGSNDVRLYVESADLTAKAITFYVDGAQMERKEYSTKYCDGDQPGCRWNLVDNGSISTRDPYTRAGGRWVALAGTCRPDNDIYATVMGGLGMPPIHNNIQAFAETPGSYYQNTKIDNRVITITFNTKNENLDPNLNPSLRRLHELRQQLVDIVKPDKTYGGEAFTLEYTDGDVPIYFDVRYEAGLEGTWDIRNSWINSFPVRFLAVSPLAYEDDQEVALLDFQDSLPVSSSNFNGARVNGKWDSLNGGLDSAYFQVRPGIKGEIYAIGQFNTANNNASAINPLIPVGGRAKWDGTSWAQVGGAAITPTIGGGGAIFDIAVSPNGYVFVVGNFTNIGGVAANRCAYFDGTNWNAMGTGLNSTGYAVAVAPNSNVYVAGIFTTAGGLSASGIAMWDGSSWHKVGQLGGLSPLTVSIFDIVISKDGTKVYVAGDFTKELSGSAGVMNHVAMLTVSTNSFSQVGSGLNGSVYTLALADNGILYAGGSFSATVTPNVVSSVNNIAFFNGSEWAQLGSGKGAVVRSISLDKNGNLFVGATSITASQTTDIEYFSLWNGSSFVNFDFSRTPAGISGYVAAVYVGTNGDLYLGMSTGVFTCAGITLFTNAGSCETSPTIYISGPCTLRWIENQSSGKRMYLDLAILNNEEVFIDFSQGKISSAIRGDLSYAILPGSDFRSWSLVPGENKISVFMFNDVNAKMQLSYTPQHHSADATARGDEMQ